MKAKTLLTALFAFLLVNGNAFQKNSSLKIDVVEQPNKTYVIEMGNGTTYETTSDIRIDNLRRGRNGIKIYKRNYRGNSQNGNQRFDERLIYTGNINIPRNSVVLSELRNRELFVNGVRPKNSNPRNNNRLGMRQRQFENLMIAVENESFDRDKLQIMSQAAKFGAMSSRQVADLMSLLSFDSFQLKFAKRAFQTTVDKQNYFLVRDGLTFASSRRKLTQFIGKQTRFEPRRPRGNRNGNRGGRR
ncbi:MAG: DUF4476 domain-containing protein [Flavobacteriales bacterium]